MKKYIFLLISVLVLTACAHQASDDTNTSYNDSTTQEEFSQKEEVSQTTAESVPTDFEGLAAPTQDDVDKLREEITVILETNKGDITIQLKPESAPYTVANFLNLARAGFYDGVKFHRVIPDFMIQAGDPNSKDNNWEDDGTGGTGYTFPDEVSSDDEIVRGILAMANAGPNTNGSQFFIVTATSTPWLNGLHTIFGEVTGGMDVVDKISLVERNNDIQNHPVEDIVIEEIQIVGEEEYDDEDDEDEYEATEQGETEDDNEEGDGIEESEGEINI